MKINLDSSHNSLGMRGSTGGARRPAQEEVGVLRDQDEANHHQGRALQKGGAHIQTNNT